MIFTTIQETARHIAKSEPELTVFCTATGQIEVLYHKTMECHKRLRAGRVPVLRQVNKDTPSATVRDALSLWETGGPDPHYVKSRKRSANAKSGG